MAGMLAVSNVGRAAAFRSGYFPRDRVIIWINHAERVGVIQSSIRIDLNTGDEPHRCSMDYKGGSGFVPMPGHTIHVGHGTYDNKMFAGRVIKVTRLSLRNADSRPTYRLDAAGWLFDIDQSRVFPGFSVQSLAPRSIVPYMLTVTSPNVASLGFTASHIAADLGAVGEFSMGPAERIGEGLSRLFRSVDAEWYMDHRGDLHAFSTVNSGTSVPTTITAASSHVWNVQYTPTDFSRVFTRVHVFGALQSTIADVDTRTQNMIPLDSASLIATNPSLTSPDVFAGTTDAWLVGGIQHVGSLIYRPESSFEVGRPSVFLPASVGANTLTVAGTNVSSVRPMEPERWYGIAGQNVYVASVIGAYSLTASSVAYSYWIPSSGPGALTTDVQNGGEIAGLWNLIARQDSSSITPAAPRYLPAGTPVQVYVTRVNSAGRDAVSSLTFSSAYGLISRSFEDQRLTSDSAAEVALAALERGDPDNWRQLEFTTREEAYDIGAPVFVSITSAAEPSAQTVEGIFTAQDVTIQGFGRLTQTKGPERTVVAGAVRRPTLWQVLQGV